MSLPQKPCFLMDHFYYKELCKPLSKEHSCKIIMLSNCYFLFWLPWQPEFLMEHNHLKEFETGPPEKHSCEVW